eukprot:7879062-Alexandrium_andersonii.AAC.1
MPTATTISTTGTVTAGVNNSTAKTNNTNARNTNNVIATVGVQSNAPLRWPGVCAPSARPTLHA